MAPAEIAIFLGAGASCAEGAPAQTALFSDFFEESFVGYRGKPENHPSLQGIKVMKNQLARFFNVFFGFDPVSSPTKALFPTFEEALGVVELALARDDGFLHFEGNLSPQQRGATLRNVRQNLVFLISLILDKKLEETCRLHRQLVGNLGEVGLLNQCAFVSFNYDILIDNALLERRPDFDLDYTVQFSNLPQRGGPDGPRPVPGIPLLKLHGSLNWLYCPTCRSVTLTAGDKGVSNLVVNPAMCRCRKCSSLAVPIIVPPTYFKVLSNIFLQQVWHRAEQILAGCRTWIFCGYSFPDADIHVKYLLKRVQVNSPGALRVFVMNWCEGKKPDQAQEEQDRYKRFLGATANLSYEKLSFEEFSANPTQFL